MLSAISTDTVRQKAFYDRDPAFIGLFYVGVKTTGVFCRVGCPARPPKPANILFFDTSIEAIHAGFRPCKLCKPLEAVGQTPPEIGRLLEELHAHPDRRIRNADLEQRGLQPDRLRRWFKKHLGLTFQAYQRSLCIAGAVRKIQHGASVSRVAFESYDSLSGFQESFRNNTGISPRASADKTVLALCHVPTPLGLMMAGIVQDKLCLLEFCDRDKLETEQRQLERLHNAVRLQAHHPLAERLRAELDEYFAGQRFKFTLPLSLDGTEFQTRVWRELCEVPYGVTRSYAEQARRIGQPSAVRAVARANGMNRISIIVPCHRVIGSDGGLTGYGGGLERKEWLLDHETRCLRKRK